MLSSLFQKSNGKPINVDGQDVHGIFCITIKDKKQDFIIHKLKAKKSPIPGLRLKVTKGFIEINGERYRDVILWSDELDDSILVSITSKSGCELKIWNVWRRPDDIHRVVEAWVSNEGMVINESGGIVTLECSNGFGEVDFSNLVVEIEKVN